MGAGGRGLTPLLLLAAVARAAPGDPIPEAVVAGRDIDAWREIEARRPEGTAAVTAWQDFLVRFPASPLAEVAWARIEALGATQATLQSHPELRLWQPWWDRSLAAHHDDLTHPPLSVAVATLRPDGTPSVDLGPQWTVGLSAGGGYDGGAPWGGLGFRVEVGIWSVVGRVGFSDQPWSLAGVRVGLPTPVGTDKPLRRIGVFGEADVRTDGRVGLLAGGRLAITPHWGVEATAGASLRGGHVGPAAGLEAVFDL